MNEQGSRGPSSIAMSNDVVRLALEQPWIGTAIVDPVTGGFLRVNDAMCTFLGRSREELMAGGWGDVTHPEDLEAVLEDLQRLRDGVIDQFRERKRYVRPDGQIVWGSLSVVRLKGADGEPDVNMSQVLDITDQVAAEQVLADSEQRYRLLAENASDLVFQGTLDGRLEWISPSVTQMLG